MQDFWCDDFMGSARGWAKCEQGFLLAFLKRDERAPGQRDKVGN